MVTVTIIVPLLAIGADDASKGSAGLNVSDVQVAAADLNEA